MAAFIKGLDQEFVEVLKKAYKDDVWWKKIVDDPDLFIGIRDNYLSVYYSGNSLMELRYGVQGLTGKVHYKYLLKEKMDFPYVTYPIVNGHSVLDKDWSKFFISDAIAMSTLKKSSKSYSGVEKQGVHEILRSNNNIIDVEAALTKDDENENRPAAQRIDFVALQRSAGSIELVFFEAKDYSNRTALRKGTGDAEVINQIERYEDLIKEHSKEIKKSYRRVCQNLIDLYPQKDKFEKIVKEVALGTNFQISSKLKLVIFSFDEDHKREGTKFNQHIDKLKAKLSKERVLLKGSAKKFTTGIKA